MKDLLLKTSAMALCSDCIAHESTQDIKPYNFTILGPHEWIKVLHTAYDSECKAPGCGRSGAVFHCEIWANATKLAHDYYRSAQDYDHRFRTVCVWVQHKIVYTKSYQECERTGVWPPGDYWEVSDL